MCQMERTSWPGGSALDRGEALTKTQWPICISQVRWAQKQLPTRSTGVVAVAEKVLAVVRVGMGVQPRVMEAQV